MDVKSNHQSQMIYDLLKILLNEDTFIHTYVYKCHESKRNE